MAHVVLLHAINATPLVCEMEWRDFEMEKQNNSAEGSPLGTPLYAGRLPANRKISTTGHVSRPHFSLMF